MKRFLFSFVDDVDMDEVRWVTQQEMKQMIQEGLICDGKTIIAYENTVTVTTILNLYN